MNKRFLVTFGGQTKPIVFEGHGSVTEGLLMQVFCFVYCGGVY